MKYTFTGGSTFIAMREKIISRYTCSDKGQTGIEAILTRVRIQLFTSVTIKFWIRILLKFKGSEKVYRYITGVGACEHTGIC